LRKKILLRGTSKEDFFSANPQGAVLTSKGLFRNLLTKKPGGILKGVKEQLSENEKWRQKVRVVWVSAGDA
jgi:hypothetical protein